MSRITPGCDFPSGDYPHRAEQWTMWGEANRRGVTLREILGDKRHPVIKRARTSIARLLYNEHRCTAIVLSNLMNRSESFGQKWSAKFRKENEVLDMRGMFKA